MTTQFIDPTKYLVYRKNGSQEECPIKTKLIIVPTATPQTLSPSTSAKKMKVMYLYGQSNATTSTGVINIQNDTSGGTLLLAAGLPARDSSTGPWQMPYQPIGHFETEAAGDGLYFSSSVQNVFVYLQYIEYTP